MASTQNVLACTAHPYLQTGGYSMGCICEWPPRQTSSGAPIRPGTTKGAEPERLATFGEQVLAEPHQAASDIHQLDLNERNVGREATVAIVLSSCSLKTGKVGPFHRLLRNRASDPPSVRTSAGTTRGAIDNRRRVRVRW